MIESFKWLKKKLPYGFCESNHPVGIIKEKNKWMKVWSWTWGGLRIDIHPQTH